MRRAFLAFVFAGLATPALGADLKTCTVLEASNPRQGAGAQLTMRVQIEGGAVVMVIATMNGRTSASDLTPVLPGISQRSVLSHDPAGWRATFNIASIAADGSVLLQTWIREEARIADDPVYIWTRLQC